LFSQEVVLFYPCFELFVDFKFVDVERCFDLNDAVLYRMCFLPIGMRGEKEVLCLLLFSNFLLLPYFNPDFYIHSCINI